jgi:hypothetical protein
MARRISAAFQVTEDKRREGFLEFADPSTRAMTSSAHTCEDFEADNAKGTSNGFNSPGRWDRSGTTMWARMNRARGVSDDGE